jgi:protein-arginine kinase activator protein McsA
MAAFLIQKPSAEIQYHIGLALKGLDRDGLALRAFQHTLLIDPDFPEAAVVREQIDALQSTTAQESKAG